SHLEHAARIPAVDQKEVVPKEQKFVTNWLAKRYRVAGDATNMLVSATYRTAKEVKIDPLLVLAVMAIESGFNPFAESPVGAQGLMQVMSKVHHDKFQQLGGVKAALNPVANIKVGATILKEYVSRGGSVESGLKMYVGAAAFENDAGYGYKVLAEYKRLKDVASGKLVPVTGTTTVAAKTPPKALPQPVADEKVDALTQTEKQQDDSIVAAL
ncbi:MAG: lytic transglycosylase domain-containing protein, partial [Noviherbaspirillum sp.]